MNRAGDANQLRTLLLRRRGFVFDFDDTLVRSRGRRTKVLQDTAKKLGFEYQSELEASAWGSPFSEMIERLIPGVRFDDFLIEYRRATSTLPPEVLPGVQETLQNARRLNIFCAVLSSSHTDLINDELESSGLAEYFDVVVGYDRSAPYMKPDPRTLLPILSSWQSRFGILMRDIILFGDSITDAQLAIKAGASFVAVTTGSHRIVDFTALGFQYVVVSLRRIAEALSTASVDGRSWG